MYLRNRERFLPYCFIFCSAVVFTLLTLFATTAAQPASGPAIMTPKKAKATLAANGAADWLPLQEPDSRFVPGTIFHAVPGQYPQWTSSLEKGCGVPKPVLKPVRDNIGTFQYFGDSVYGASALLRLPGISARPEFTKAQTVAFQQSDAGASAIDVIQVRRWIRKDDSAFSIICPRFLAKPNTYVAQESHRSGNGTYTLRDSKDVSLQSQGLFFISSSVSIKKSGESSLSLTVPVYTAVHGAVHANDLLKLMTAPAKSGLHYADTDINSLLADLDMQDQPKERNVQLEDISSAQPEHRSGTYHALVIGIDHYEHEPELMTPVNDATEVAELLKNRYGFQTQTLLDTDASRDHVIKALEQYASPSSSLTENDSLLIYFAGHGQRVVQTKQAYWAPVDAGNDSYSHWISATEIADEVKAIPARHVLIVSDSCYSGLLAIEREASVLIPDEREHLLERLLKRKSRNILSSGADEPVQDGGCPHHSIFACVFLNYLQESEGPDFTAGELFLNVRSLVGGKSRQLPQYQIIRNSDDDGGEFVFFPDPKLHEGPLPPPAVNTTLPEVSPDKEQIYATLKSYQEGYAELYARRDIHKLKSVWPSMTSKQEQELKDGARMPGLSDVKIELRNNSITISGDTAKVQSDQYMIHKEFNLDKPPQTHPITIVLKKSTGGWVIDSL